MLSSIPVACVFAIGLVGWGILIGVNPIGATASDLHVRYFGCICIVTAGYGAIPLVSESVPVMRVQDHDEQA